MDAAAHDPVTGEIKEGGVASVNVAGAAGQLRSYVDRIERLEADKAEIAADISEVYKEAKGNGFHPAALRKVVAERKKDAQRREEEGALFQLYWDAVH